MWRHIAKRLLQAIPLLLGIATLDLPAETPIPDGLFSIRQYRTGDLGAPLPHDPVTAAALLAAAGWTDRDGDGMRERDGVPATFTLLVPVAQRSTLRTTERAAVAVQASLRARGVRVVVQPLEANLARQRLRTGDFEAVLLRFPNDPGDVLRDEWFGERSPLGYVNPRLATLLAEADAADPEARDRVLRAITEVLREEVPVTFLYPHGWATVVRRQVRGLTPPHRVNPFTHAEELWLEARP
jgi:peptide/nickel transport system substrate-binding protein